MLIYIITNDVNSKVYIGQTTKTLEDRMKGHYSSYIGGTNTHIYNAMRKYGWDKFHFSVLKYANTQEELDYLEAYYINEYDSIKNGYNMIPGGRVNPMDYESIQQKHDSIMKSEAVRDQIAKSVKDFYKNQGGVSQEVRRKLSENKKAFYQSPEGLLAKQKFHETFKLSPEHYRALNDAKNKAVYCIDEANNVIAEFKRVKDAAIWWYSQGYVVKSTDQLMDKIRESYKKDKFIKGLKWIYRV